MRHAPLAALTLAILVATAACSGGSTPAPSASPASASSPAASSSTAASSSAAASAQAGAGTASIVDFGFQPASVTVPVGGTVTWTNTGAVGHTVTADDGSFKSDTLAAGATFSHTFAAAGTFAYHCTIHPSMKATVIVQ